MNGGKKEWEGEGWLSEEVMMTISEEDEPGCVYTVSIMGGKGLSHAYEWLYRLGGGRDLLRPANTHKHAGVTMAMGATNRAA